MFSDFMCLILTSCLSACYTLWYHEFKFFVLYTNTSTITNTNTNTIQIQVQACFLQQCDICRRYGLSGSQVMYLYIVSTTGSFPFLPRSNSRSKAYTFKCINTFVIWILYPYAWEVYGGSDKAMLVRILTWATRNHWITGQGGRGSPLPQWVPPCQVHQDK